MLDIGKVLVVDDIEAIREIVIFYLQSIVKAEVIEASSGFEAVEKFNQYPGITLVISDQNMENGKGTDLYQAIRKTSTVPFILHTTDAVETQQALINQPGFYFLPKPMNLPQFDETLRKILGKNAIVPRAPGTETYAPVRLSLIRRMGKSSVPLFIRISDQKYVKIHKEGEIEKDFLVDREKNNQIHVLFILQTDILNYIEEYQKYIQATLDHPDLKMQASIQQALTTAELLNSVQMSLGVSPDVERLVKHNIDVVSKLASEKNELKDIAEDLHNSDATPLAKHIILVSMIAISVAKKLNWVSDKTSDKFVFAALLHDMTIEDEEFDSEMNLKKNPLSANFKNHPLKAAEVAQNWRECPGDVASIVSQHHEVPDGSGYPLGLTASRITPLAAVFIVSHELALAFISEGKYFFLTKWIAENHKRFSEGDFKKAIDALMSMNKNKPQS